MDERDVRRLLDEIGTGSISELRRLAVDCGVCTERESLTLGVDALKASVVDVFRCGCPDVVVHKIRPAQRHRKAPPVLSRRRRAPIDWYKRYRMPFKPDTESAMVWRIVEPGINVVDIENEVRTAFNVVLGRNVGVTAGNILVNVLRTACQRGWAVEILEVENTLTHGRLVVRYVGEPTEMPK